MPLSPFIGLSVLIHLGTILVFKVLRRQTNEVVITKRKKTTLVMRSFSMVIIFVVFTFVTSSAMLLLYGSVTEKHSTINFISHQLSVFINSDYVPVSNVSAASINSEPKELAEPVEVEPINQCITVKDINRATLDK